MLLIRILGVYVTNNDSRGLHYASGGFRMLARLASASSVDCAILRTQYGTMSQHQRAAPLQGLVNGYRSWVDIKLASCCH